jgi:hypothetical protein
MKPEQPEQQEVYVVSLPVSDESGFHYRPQGIFTYKKHATNWSKLNRGVIDGPLPVYTVDICPPQDPEERKRAKILHKLECFLTHEEIELLGL